MYYVYVLQLVNNTFYTGFSSDLRERYRAHDDGDVPQTRKLRPIQLVYFSAFVSKQKALEFEKYLKSSSGFAFRNKHLV